MRRLLPMLVLVLAALAGPAAALAEPPTPPGPGPEKIVREIFVPFEDLNALLEGDPNRVLLSREQYETLLAKAKKEAESRPPQAALVVSADYDAKAGDERAEITGTLVVSILEDGLHAIGLDVGGVGLRGATLDGHGAAIGLADDGRLTLFVEGKGRHTLVLDMVTAIQTTAARQILSFRLPTPPAARLRLTVPGDVEVKSGAPVVTRVFDEKADVTRIEVLPQRGDVSLVMTLNSRLLRKDRIVVARSVLLDEVTAAYERLHVTVSMGILHRAVRDFRFAVPAGFEVTDVRSPNLARWAIVTEGDRRILDVQLRDETTETVVLNLSAVRTAPDLASWALSKLEPLDVVGHVAVVGLAVEDRLKAEAISPEGLIPIDTAVLAKALPATVLEAQPGAARIRPVVAYYAPQAAFGLAARFVRPPARLRVTTNLLAVLEDGGLTVRGGFALVPEEEKLFAFDFSAPAGWDVTAVTGADGNPVPFERYGAAGQTARVHVRLPSGIPAGTERQVYFTAVHVPKTWFSEWAGTSAEFPVFAVAGAARDVGAIAVDARDDMTVRPETLEGLTPLDENEKTRYGLAGVAAVLAYRYEGQPYRARLTVERTLPRVTAQTFSFFRVERDVLVAHYEIVYDVAGARTRRLALVLPETTPTALAIRGLDDVAVKEYTSETVGEKDTARRRWTALLAERQSGTVRLAVDFEQRLDQLEPEDLALPVVEADGVAYQSGLVAVEGSPELDVRIAAHPRKVDIGELVDAEYQPGRRLLGAYGFVGVPAAVRVSVARHPTLGLPPAIIQRAELATVMSADGVAQTAARFLLRTKALFLEVRLPKGSTLWSATLDSDPIKPQREADRMLLNLPAAAAGAVRDLLVVYETPVGGLGFWRGVDVPAPRLVLHAGTVGEGEEVPVADLLWRLFMPTGYKVIRSEGSVVTHEVAPPPLAVANVASALYYGSGGVDFDHGALGLVLGFGGCAAQMAAPKVQMVQNVGQRPGREVAEQLSLGGVEADEEAGGESREEFKRAEGEKNGRTGGMRSRGRVAGGKEDADRLHKRMPAGPDGDESASAAEPDAKPAEEPAPATPPPPTATTAPARPAKAPVSKKDIAKEQLRKAWALEGVASLDIRLVPTGEAVTFRSLGSEPRLDLTVADGGRIETLAWGLALAVIVVGVALTTQRVWRKAAYVVGVGLVATLIPVITARIELAMVVNGAFYAACVLIPYYLAASCVRWFAGKVRGAFVPPVVAAGMVLVAAALLMTGAPAAAEEKDGPYVVQIVPPPKPVKVPADAIILPYDPASKTGIQEAGRLLVPYDKYVELWNLAYPDKPIGAKPPPAPYALAGAAFRATLRGDEFLLVEGTLDVDVYADDYVAVPLPLEGGVLAKADLDGRPARLSVADVDPSAPQSKDAKEPPKRSFVVLYVSGKGRHRLDVAVRMRLSRRGGWRVTEGRVPAAPATALTLTVPDAGTEVRLGGVSDRAVYETKAAGEAIRTALGADGSVGVQWRPKVAEGQLDQTLTADSQAVLDVQEDSLRLVWSLHLEFRHGERDFFTVEVPAGYAVEKVEGTNVRGWELKDAAGRREVTVTLLKRAKGSEDFTVSIWQQAGQGAAPFGGQPFEVPVIGVTGAQRHTGRLVIRRSPLLDLRTVGTTGVRRDDLPAETKKKPQAGAAEVESPLGIRPFQAYAFVATPFSVRLAAEPVAARKSATVQMIVRVAERERSLEARATLSVENRPLYWARFVVPPDLDLERVLAPGAFEWALTDDGGRKVLTVYLAGGVQGQCPIVIQGKLGQDAKTLETAVPRIEVLDVERQQGDVVVQVDPAFDVRTEDLANIERVLLQQVSSWLSNDQKGLAVLALHYTRPDYAGRLVLAARQPDVACFTVTNSRVTDRSIDETILVNWTIKNAGVREVTFLLPAWMKDARIQVPLLRQKTITPVGDDGAMVRVRLELQDEVMDDLRVLVENDRLLSAGTHDVPIPVVETGRTDRRYVAIESAGRDEVVIAQQDGLESLNRQQKEWAAVAGILRGGMTQAFIVAPGAEAPRLAFQTKERAAVETVGARIGLAQTDLVMDSSGAYRGQVVYRIDNRIEQFLEVEMPQGAALWTAVVAGEPVKPTLMDDAAAPRRVRIPIVKTASGDLDYAVVLKYGGRIESLGALAWSVEFPLVRAVNINAELSQVQLYLPETHVWFDFGGTMTRVTEAGTLEAGLLSYQNKVADRLMQTLRSENPFAQMRAKSNLANVGQSLQGLQEDLKSYRGNATVQTELSSSATILQSVGREIESQEKAQRDEVGYNNDSMRELYAGQRNRRARNLVQDLSPNWKESAQKPAARPADQPQFNEAWFDQNALANKEAEAAQGKVGVRFRDSKQVEDLQRKQVQAPGQAGVQMFDNFAILGDKAGKAQEKAKQAAEPQQRGLSQAAVVERYQRKLEQRAGQQQPQTATRGTVVGGGAGGRAWGYMTHSGAAVTHGGTILALVPATGAAGPGDVAGAASLDVDLPRRGTLIQFTVPRGEVEVTARSASMPLIEGLERVGGAAVLVILIALVRRWLRGREVGLRAQAAVSTALIVLGVVGLAIGIFPVAGLLTVLVGVGMKVRLFFARRRPAAA